MDMNKKYSSGFSVTFVLVIVLIIAILGGVGYVGYRTLTKKEMAASTAPIKTDSTTADTQNFDDVVPNESIDGFIDYEHRSGASMTKASDTSLLKGAPSGFVSYLKAELNNTEKNQSCPDDPYTIVVNRLDEHFAAGSVGGCSGARVVWGEQNGTWQELTGTNNLGFSCEDLYKYRVSVAVAGDTCTRYGDNGGFEVYQP